MAVKYWSVWGRYAHGDVSNYLFYMVRCMDTLIGTACLMRLPVFEPNEYFWEHHWNEGKEEKWVAFARAVREIIATAGDFGLSPSTMEDKMEYKALVKARKLDAKKN